MLYPTQRVSAVRLSAQGADLPWVSNGKRSNRRDARKERACVQRGDNLYRNQDLLNGRITLTAYTPPPKPDRALAFPFVSLPKSPSFFVPVTSAAIG